MTEDEITLLKNQIKQLNIILEKKDSELESLLDKAQDLEDELLKFHEIIAEGVSLENVEKVLESKFKFELKAKDREIRDLKDKLGFLRKEKLEKERELDEFKENKSNSSTLRVEDIRYKQRIEQKDKIINDLEKLIEGQERKIEYLNALNTKIEQKQISKASLEKDGENKPYDQNTKEEYKNKIKKYKSKIKKLKIKLSESGKDDKSRIKMEIELLDLKNIISRLEKDVDEKNQKIKELETLIQVLQK